MSRLSCSESRDQMWLTEPTPTHFDFWWCRFPPAAAAFDWTAATSLTLGSQQPIHLLPPFTVALPFSILYICGSTVKKKFKEGRWRVSLAFHCFLCGFFKWLRHNSATVKMLLYPSFTDRFGSQPAGACVLDIFIRKLWFLMTRGLQTTGAEKTFLLGVGGNQVPSDNSGTSNCVELF